MIAGHAPIAFAIAAGGAAWLGVERRRALLFGLAAGAFAVVPDVDMLYALFGVLQADPTGVWTATAAFWDSSRAVHRAMTHSLVLAVPAAFGFALAAGGRRAQVAASVPLVGLVALGWFVEGTLAAAMLALFAGAGVAVGRAAAGTGLEPRAVLLAALVGLGTHPFGDFFTGSPPPLAYPLSPEAFGGRVTLAADPTLNLLAVFGLELAAVWLGVVVAARLLGWSVRDAVDRRVTAGAAYGAAVFVLPPPTMEASYHFVFSVLAVGTVGAGPLVGSVARERLARAAVSGIAAVTLAVAAYALIYAVA